MQSGNDEVADLQWSPYNSTVLGTVTVDGRLEIWDLASSTLKPALHTKVPGSKLSCMLFLEGDPIVMTGGECQTTPWEDSSHNNTTSPCRYFVGESGRVYTSHRSLATADCGMLLWERECSTVLDVDCRRESSRE